ncbi:TetR/AcrR family transcriptional regulator [Sporolactobacillus nakayamae]|uniref:Transcriptional regulator, TetR family n=1 Tax=Sporolactobacillus nakayamae TaxID=269670 RepID=A0A1I2TYR4_9BACL|nr:TetR/AcrR family transcriptional regulator [Sporolactobacillus nakayamae]SFG70030.1 transcriptional regulator, TetR family [Sporolactobacillus nakayamae]
MQSKRVMQKEKKRTAIVDAAERLFFSKGFARTTMDDLCQEARLSKRTLYIYFTSKEQLHFEIMIRGYKQLIALLDEASEEHVRADAKLREMADAFYRFRKDFPDYFRTIFSYENAMTDFRNSVQDSSREECYALGEVVFGKLAALISEGKDEGIFREELDTTQTAVVLWSCMSGVLNNSLIKKNYLQKYHSISSDFLIHNAFELMLRSIRNDNGGPI